MKYDDFIEVSTRVLDRNFPKGECGERGNALALVAELMLELKDRGVLKN